MPKIRYDFSKRFTVQTLDVIDTANAILEEYDKQGFSLTLRQLYYKFVARKLFPADRKWSNVNGKWRRDPNGTINADPNYDWLGQIMSEARMCGLVDWDFMVDRTRRVRTLQHFDGATDALKKLASWYHVDMWENQVIRPEVWVEKDAMIGILEPICQEFDVPFFSCRGYTSQSEMWRAAMRLKNHHDMGYTTHIIHFGDHDPSGVDMSRDIFDRIETFMGGTEFTRVALTMDQVREYNPPPDPAKITDSRCKAYIEKYGHQSWELDALEPVTLHQLVRDSVTALLDQKTWDDDVGRKNEVKDRLTKLSTQWPDVSKWMDKEVIRKKKLADAKAKRDAARAKKKKA